MIGNDTDAERSSAPTQASKPGSPWMLGRYRRSSAKPDGSRERSLRAAM
jgi:hypothetical protein